MKQPSVSIIVPCYNVAKHLESCLQSLVNQSLSNIEIICIDDKSNDDTLTILKKYAKEDSRIIVRAMRKNSGVSMSRNRGLALARGEFIGFVDGDDIIDNDFYETLYKCATRAGADIAKAELYVESNGNISENKDFHNSVRANKYNFLRHFTSAIYRTQLLQDNDIVFPKGLTLTEDTCFLVSAVHKAKSVSVIDGTAYHYIRYSDSADSAHYNATQVNAAISGYKHLLNWLNAQNDISDENYAVVSRYIATLALYPTQKTTEYNLLHQLSLGMYWVIQNVRYPNILESIFGKKVFAALSNNNIDGVVNFLQTKKYRVRLFGKITISHISARQKRVFGLLGLKLLTID